MKAPLVRVSLPRLILECALAGSALVLCVPLTLAQPGFGSFMLLTVLFVLIVLIAGTVSSRRGGGPFGRRDL
ncbi:hypothetical protein [Arachnia propionica]|uniref:Uncharacterized protein n=1 Tax=Arachnia propionica TaxID=1750 RepID=A0A3P1WUN6_9ACTN|nr:hypothetical protein [Arachnia propionica]RRD50292.1 hypothetical protein EII35_04890 [Arachnia propionica]